jgi:chemotaxis protein methyltransferase CheR
VLKALPRFGCETISQLQDRVLRDGAVLSALLHELAVPVSDLFRDPAFFAAVRREVAPVLRTYPSVKLWVAGCATGEEVWSYLILLEEEGLLDRALVYATDIDLESLRAARAGVYRLDRAQRFSDNYRQAGGQRSLSEYYVAAYDGIVFDRRLASRVVFSDHSLATDGVFAEVQLVSCRNVLIYFDRPLQDRAVKLFADSLGRRGFLGLGSHENLRFSRHADLFEPVAAELRLYRRRM